MRSMTGFGSGSGNDGKLAVTLEMRAVNQRFLELNIRMPHAYLALEDRLRNGIKAVLKRGKVDVFVTVQDLDPAAPDVRVDSAKPKWRRAASESILARRLWTVSVSPSFLFAPGAQDWVPQRGNLAGRDPHVGRQSFCPIMARGCRCLSSGLGGTDLEAFP